MIVTFGSQKGGSGKSSSAANLAVEFASRGNSVCLFDADRQQSLKIWNDRRSINDVAEAFDIQVHNGSIHQKINQIKSNYDYVFVDTAGHDSYELRSALICTDIMLVPFKPSQVDVDTFGMINKVLEKGQQVNNQLKAAYFWVNTSTHYRSKQVEQADYVANHYPRFNRLDTALPSRRVYDKVWSEGLGVVESSDQKAKNEVAALCDSIEKFINEM